MNSTRRVDFSTTTDYCPEHTIENNPSFIPLSGHYINGFIAGDVALSIRLGGK